MMPLSSNDLDALYTTLQLAIVTTTLLLIICIPLAWWLAFSNSRLKYSIQAIVTLPLVLPPTVLGFYLLILLSSNGLLGKITSILDLSPLAFSFSGLVIGSMIYSLPFVVQPIYLAFVNLRSSHLEKATTLGSHPIDRFFSIALPLSKRGIFTAMILGVAHTIGEFGVVLMIGGNIPGQTRVLSIAIYDHVENLAYSQAHWLAAMLLVISFVALFAIFVMNHRQSRG